MAYHILVEGEQTGPFEEDVVAAMIAGGAVTPTTRVWAPGMDEWQDAGAVEALKFFFAEPPDVAEPEALVQETVEPEPVESDSTLPDSTAQDLEAAEKALDAMAAAAAAAALKQPLNPHLAIGAAASAIGRQPFRALVFAAFIIILILLIALPTLIPLMPKLTFMDNRGRFWIPKFDLIEGAGLFVSLILLVALFGGVNVVMLDAVRGVRIRLKGVFAGVPQLPRLTAIVGCLAAIAYVGVVLTPSAEGVMGYVWLALMAIPTAIIISLLYCAMFFVLDCGTGVLGGFAVSIRMVFILGFWRTVKTVLFATLIGAAVTTAFGTVLFVLSVVSTSFTKTSIFEINSFLDLGVLAWVTILVSALVGAFMLMFGTAVYAAIYRQGRKRVGLESKNS